MIAAATEHVGLQVQVDGVARLGGEQALHFGECLVGTVLLVQHQGVGVARSREARRAREAALEQHRGVVPASRAHGEVGQHAQGSRVVGELGEMHAQQPFGVGKAALAQSRNRREQARTARRDREVVGPGCVRPGRVARFHPVVGDQLPRVADVGLQRDRTLERRQRLVAPAGEP